MHAPLKQHLDVVYRILRYLKKASRKGILFKKGSKLKLEAYTDSDWVGAIVDRRLTIEYCTFLRPTRNHVNIVYFAPKGPHDFKKGLLG